MIETKKTYTDAQFIPSSTGNNILLIIVALFILFSPYIIPFIYTIDTPPDSTFIEMIRSICIFFQLFPILLPVEVLSEVLLVSVYGIFFPSKKGDKDFGQSLRSLKPFSAGTFKGICPYCGAPNDVTATQDEFRGIDCPKCKNRFLLRDGKFFQLDPPSPLDARFSGIRNGLLLVQIASVTTSLAPAIFILGVILATLATLAQDSLLISVSALLLPAFSVILLVVSMAVQTAGMWQCLQAPEWSPRNPAKTWITAAVFLQVMTLVLLIGKLLTLNQSNTLLLNALLGICGFLCQFTFLVFLMRFCSFTQRADLRDEFRGILTNFTILTILFLLVPLAELVLPASYKTPLLVLMALLAWGTFMGYFFRLRRLNSHTSQALATYNLGALGRN